MLYVVFFVVDDVDFYFEDGVDCFYLGEEFFGDFDVFCEGDC